jgi:hypothetical protein
MQAQKINQIQVGLQTILQAFHSGLNGKFTDRKMTMGPISSIQAPTS